MEFVLGVVKVGR